MLLQKKSKIKHKPRPVRDSMTNTVFNAIMNSEKPKNVQGLTWHRFKITVVILYFTGLRVNEVAYTTKNTIDLLKTNLKCEFYQKKVNASRVCFIPKFALPYFDKIENDINQVFDSNITKDANGQVLLYPFIESNPYKWIKLINTNLTFFAKEFNLELKSHNFRIGYVTRILKHSSVDKAKAFVGHKDIRSTMAYNRYQIGDPNSLNVLADAFNDDSF